MIGLWILTNMYEDLRKSIEPNRTGKKDEQNNQDQ